MVVVAYIFNLKTNIINLTICRVKNCNSESLVFDNLGRDYLEVTSRHYHLTVKWKSTTQHPRVVISDNKINFRRMLIERWEREKYTKRKNCSKMR